MKGTEVFVGGLPVTATESAIREVFSGCGEIVDVRLIKDQKGNAKGFCFVRFSTKEAADKALKEKSGVVLDGKKIGLRPSTEQDTLYFGNLNKGWNANEFEALVRQVFPDVLSVDLVSLPGELQSEKKRNRGFAFVKFTSHAAAARALRVGSKPEFLLGNLHPAVQWVEEQPEIDPAVLSKIKIAFIKNLPGNADESFLRKLFEPFGEIEKVVLWKKGGLSLGFVHFTKRSALENAIREMHDKILQWPEGGPTHKLSVEIARPTDKSKKRIREDSQSNMANKVPNNLEYIPGVKPESYRCSVVKPFGQKEEVYEDPYEAAVLSLPVTVKERLLRILRLRIATRFDIDIQNITSLKQLPESTAISVLDQFMLSGAEARNKGVYLAGLIARYQGEHQRASRSPGGMSRVGDYAATGSGVSSYSDRVLYAPDDSFGRSVGSGVRSEKYVPHYSAVVPDYPMLSRPLLGRAETNHSPLQPTSTSYAPYAKLKLSPEMDDLVSGVPTTYAAFRRDAVAASPLTHRQVKVGDMADSPTARPQVRFSDVSGHPSTQFAGRLEGVLDRPLSRPQVGFDDVTNRLPSQPRVRFDPYTGEPYRFDPYTGERILPYT
ncbi:OLC1v1009731C1 [Oldenlandia corymbosa var. corymbosa]|uniref:OLC1v1009731C1 n=1 Tax=Oldenlandia corymbosa var. corymbosa TaxID=529605 RepID=A0AAV1DS99_OLDCO|nr:OLC1v1009731C1 [Oldenlandia corymbosa var. corymbosa]